MSYHKYKLNEYGYPIGRDASRFAESYKPKVIHGDPEIRQWVGFWKGDEWNAPAPDDKKYAVVLVEDGVPHPESALTRKLSTAKKYARHMAYAEVRPGKDEVVIIKR
jgi:hypothetical protein